MISLDFRELDCRLDGDFFDDDGVNDLDVRLLCISFFFSLKNLNKNTVLLLLFFAGFRFRWFVEWC